MYTQEQLQFQAKSYYSANTLLNALFLDIIVISGTVGST